MILSARTTCEVHSLRSAACSRRPVHMLRKASAAAATRARMQCSEPRKSGLTLKAAITREGAAFGAMFLARPSEMDYKFCGRWSCLAVG